MPETRTFGHDTAMPNAKMTTDQQEAYRFLVGARAGQQR